MYIQKELSIGCVMDGHLISIFVKIGYLKIPNTIVWIFSDKRLGNCSSFPNN